MLLWDKALVSPLYEGHTLLVMVLHFAWSSQSSSSIHPPIIFSDGNIPAYFCIHLKISHLLQSLMGDPIPGTTCGYKTKV